MITSNPQYDLFLKFRRADGDLAPCRESWMSDNYKNRLSLIKKNMVSDGRKKGSPSPNMILIKEAYFPISEKVFIPDLLNLIEIIRDEYKAECFQITIDRKENMAHLLFDWYDKSSMQSYYMNRSVHIMLSVLIIKTLNLPYPEGSQDWGIYYIKYATAHHPGIFNRILQTAKRTFESKLMYETLKDMINYHSSRLP